MFDTQLGDSVSKAQEEGSEGLSLANAKQLEEANGQSSANMEMLSITVPTYSPPSGYELTTIPRPTVSAPTDVVIEVHATSINPIDVKKASGALKMALAEQFPYRIGFDCAGVVSDIGMDVKRFKVGDEVYVRLPERDRGAWAEYALCDETYIALKPKSLSFGDAASVPLAALTALQTFMKYSGSLEGKTVFVPSGLSGTGSYACQLAKRVFKAGKVITTVSTKKVPLVHQLLGDGVVDQVIDYTKESPNTVISRSSVDFCLDTTGQAMDFLSLMVPKTSLIISISTTPSGTQLQAADFMNRPDRPRLPWWGRMILNAMDAVRQARAWRWGVQYSYFFLGTNAEDLETLTRYVEEWKVRPVVGSRVPFGNLEKVKEAAEQVYDGKGGIGKTVILVK